MKNSTLLYLNAVSGFIFGVLMVLKYGFDLLPAIFLLWPILILIFSYFNEIRELKDYNHHIHYTVDGNIQVSGNSSIILHLVAYITLYFVPSLRSNSWTLLIAAIPLLAFLFVTKDYCERLGAMLAQNRFSPAES